jgi:microcystin-dependent protein
MPIPLTTINLSFTHKIPFTTMETFIGQICLVGFNFAPRGFALCNGQLLSIAQNSALFALLGTIYGGNGQTTFALPDLRGRTPIHMGEGPGLSNHIIGERAGVEATTLTIQNMPPHNHSLNAVSESGNVGSPLDANLAATGALDPEYRVGGSGIQMANNSIGVVGGGQGFTNMQPYLTLNYVIALEGIFPSRN